MRKEKRVRNHVRASARLANQWGVVIRMRVASLALKKSLRLVLPSLPSHNIEYVFSIYHMMEDQGEGFQFSLFGVAL
jgi:hypothetical protein